MIFGGRNLNNLKISIVPCPRSQILAKLFEKWGNWCRCKKLFFSRMFSFFPASNFQILEWRPKDNRLVLRGGWAFLETAKKIENRKNMFLHELNDSESKKIYFRKFFCEWSKIPKIAHIQYFLNRTNKSTHFFRNDSSW